MSPHILFAAFPCYLTFHIGNMFYHPLIDSVAVVSLSIVSIGLTEASIPQRIGYFVVLSWLTWHCIAGSPIYTNRSSLAALVGGQTLAILLHYSSDVGVFNRWKFEQQGPVGDLTKGPLIQHTKSRPTSNSATTQKQYHSSMLAKLEFGLLVFCSWRFVGTPHQVRNIPRLKENIRHDCAAFLMYTGITTAAYLLWDVMHLSQDPQVAKKFFSVEEAGLFSRIHSVTPEELSMRFFAAPALGVSLVSGQRGAYYTLPFVFVGKLSKAMASF